MNSPNVRQWLSSSGYADVLLLIEETEAQWKSNGCKTRRSWWDVLAGNKNGEPWHIEGREFPVLRAAQIRMGKRVTPNAIWRKKELPVPSKIAQARWDNRSASLSESIL